MINLLYCGNNKVFDGMLVSLLSIIKYTSSQINVYVITMDLREIDERNIPVSEDQIAFLENVIKEKNTESSIKRIDVTELFLNDMKNSPNLTNSYTPYTLTRLYADQCKELPDRILYLDTDTIARTDISSVFSYDISDYEFAGVIDYLGKVFIRYNYMNAGVLFLNLDKIRERETFAKAIHMCKNKKMWFPDQTALNRVVKKKMFLPTRYNEQRKLRNNTVIQHFCKSIRWFPFFHTVNVKPWQVNEMHTIHHLYAYDDILKEYQKRISDWKKENKVES